jgi:hypothetical protein
MAESGRALLVARRRGRGSASGRQPVHMQKRERQLEESVVLMIRLRE